MKPFSIAIHGGAGTLVRGQMTAEKEAIYLRALKTALEAGYGVLNAGGTALEAVKSAVVELENDDLFNAGKGAVFTNTGSHELDASIMDGRTLSAGAVGAVKYVRNPILLADKIMTSSEHVFMGGEGALDFAKLMGLEIVPDDYFYSDLRYQQWKLAKEEDKVALDHNISLGEGKKFGTVGAVALDQFGNLAAGTSTGGMTNKKFGRMGDTHVIGSGTYANNNTCAISCTGHGEIFLQAVAAYDVSALMEYRGMSLQQAMDEVVNKKLVKMGVEGGMIGVDRIGNCVMLFNSEGMYRGMKSSSGREEFGIYGSR